MKTLKLTTAFTLISSYAIAGGMPDAIAETSKNDFAANVENTLTAAADSFNQIVEFAFMALFLVL